MVDAVHGNTELGSTKEAVIAAIVQRELQFRAKFAPFFTDVSAFATPGSKTIDFPKMTSFTVTKRVEGTAGDATTVDTSNDTLALNQNAYVAWIVDKVTALQSKINVLGSLAQRAASAHARSFDVDMATELSLVAGLNINGGVGADITRDNILTMIDFVEGNEGILEDSTFFIHTGMRKALLNIAEFSENRLYGSNVIATGNIPTLYGIPVVFHNGIGVQQAYLADRSSCVYGFQSAPAMDDQPANEYGVGARRHAMDQLYGIRGQQLGEQGVAGTESPLVAKLKD